jgi:urease subunit alpha
MAGLIHANHQEGACIVVSSTRKQYTDFFGPTVGDKIRLADTSLYIQVERDLGSYGDEVIYGGGKTARDGMGQESDYTNEHGILDLVITNVVIVDALLGVVKADIGVKDGRIAGIGKAGNPDTMDGVTANLVVGAGTDVISGEHLIATAGGIDSHVHFISPQQAYVALSGGITTVVGGGTGPSDSSNGCTMTPGPWNISQVLRASERLPINIGILGKGSASGKDPLIEQLLSGACGFKVHEDWGAQPSVIHRSLEVADAYDVQVSIHTDTLNEAGFVEDTITAIDGRSIHTYHSEGAGGGHAPDLLRITGERNVLPSSTNCTRPFCVNTADETTDMIITVHHLDPRLPEDVAFASSRVRAETMAAEDVLHDRGVISMYSSDSQAMGRIGEDWVRLMQTADKMKNLTGPLPGEDGNDNLRVLRYIAKVTINPAITHGMAHTIGSLEPGKLADIVLWNPAFFGAKPKMIIKGGTINWSIMGDPNASVPTAEPNYYRPMFGSFGGALPATCVSFVSTAAYEDGIRARLGLERLVLPVRNCRSLTKKHMVRNDATPKIEVNPQTYAVMIDGKHATVPPAEKLALAQLYFLS